MSVAQTGFSEPRRLTAFLGRAGDRNAYAMTGAAIAGEALSARLGLPLARLSALATLPVVVRHRPDVKIVWFDAHADANTPESSATGYLGGIILTGAAGLWETGLGKGLNLADVVLVGCRDIDPPELALIDSGILTS